MSNSAPLLPEVVSAKLAVTLGVSGKGKSHIGETNGGKVGKHHLLGHLFREQPPALNAAFEQDFLRLQF